MAGFLFTEVLIIPFTPAINAPAVEESQVFGK